MTPEREAALETLPPAVAADKEWKIYKMRNDSLMVDLFQGQYRNRMECLTCHKVSPRVRDVEDLVSAKGFALD
jgi:ubiquitin carboxyl-terminal hydrolase 8